MEDEPKRYGALGIFTEEEAEREVIVDKIKASGTLEGMSILLDYKNNIVKKSKVYFMAANAEQYFKVFEEEMKL